METLKVCIAFLCLDRQMQQIARKYLTQNEGFFSCLYVILKFHKPKRMGSTALSDILDLLLDLELPLWQLTTSVLISL